MNGAMNVTVQAIREVASGVREFTLARTDGEAFPPYSAGSHVVLALPVGARVHRNPYSLLGDPADRQRWRIAVHRHPDSRGGSAWLHEHAGAGTTFPVSMPANLFPLVRTGRLHLLFAGGIGITPILAQARELQRLGLPFEVHYGVRGPHAAAFLDELLALAPARITCHDASAGQRMDFDTLLAARPLGTHAYACGPAGMVAAFHAAAQALGWPAAHVHSERFTAPAGGEPFVVELERSRVRFTVPADLSLLEAIEQQGVEAPSLCRGGACGQCECTVLRADGALLHRDVWLDEADRAAGRKIMPCVSRAAGGCLVLDL